MSFCPDLGFAITCRVPRCTLEALAVPVCTTSRQQVDLLIADGALHLAEGRLDVAQDVLSRACQLARDLHGDADRTARGDTVVAPTVRDPATVRAPSIPSSPFRFEVVVKWCAFHVCVSVFVCLHWALPR